MPRTLHPALKAGAAAALALALTSTTGMPATALSVGPGAVARPVVPAAPAAPAEQQDQTASEVTGADEETLALGGIDAEALPEAPEAAAGTPVESEPATPQESAPADDAPADDTPADVSTEGETAESTPAPTTVAPATPSPSETGAEAGADADAVIADLTALRIPATGTERPAADRETQPADVVLQDLQRRAEAAGEAVQAPVAAEATELTESVMDRAAATTGELDVAKIATLTQPVETIDFVVAGVTWDIADAGHVTDVSLRVREESGWTDWNGMEIHSGDEKPSADRVGTEPLVSTGADAIQVRITTVDGTVPAGLELELIDPGTAETDGQLEPASPASPALSEIESQADLASVEGASPDAAPAAWSGPGTTAAAEFVPAVPSQQGPLTGTAEAAPVSYANDDILKPGIITRAQWGANESWTTDWGHTSTDLQAMYVHHTAGSNSYTEAGAYEQIRGIYRYHAVTLGWEDIGYQFLVDKYGNIFQGRRGSLDAPVQGAQAGGFNTDTIGVSAMGNYDVAAAPAAMVKAIERVLAWQAYRYDVDPTAWTTLTQSGKGTARWWSGYQATVPTILGHRVTNLTACPGRYLDAKLSTIRTNVDAAVSAALANHGEFAPTPPAPRLPYAPYAVSSNGADATARWYPVDGADTYQIMYRAVPHGSGRVSDRPWLAGKTVSTNNADLSNLPGETAQYAVRAIRNGVAGPQVYLGQHTAPIDWDNADVHTARYETTSSSGGVEGRAIRATAGTAVVRVEDTAQAQRLGLALYVPSGGVADLAVYQDSDRYVGTIRVRQSGSAYCALALPGGSNVRVVAQNDTAVMVSRLDLARSGQSDLRSSSSKCEVPFRDNAPGSRFYAPVDWMFNADISSGYSQDNTFRKDREISRGESAAFIYRYLDPAYTPTLTAPFTDVRSGDTFYGAVSWAKYEKISQGYADGSFGVSRNVTRGEFASFLYRAAEPRFTPPSTKVFPDVSVGSAHHPAIAWMEKEGLAGGYSDGTFRPNRTITRAEVSAILYRFDRN